MAIQLLMWVLQHKIKTEKTLNGVTTKYHVVDENVTFESNGTDNIYYTYDTYDIIVRIEVNGVEYCLRLK